MTRSLFLAARVARGGAMSMLLVVLCFVMGPAAAHEVLPAIVRMEQQGDTLVFSVDANLEGYVAGIDLSAAEDTDDAEQAERYDELRALPPEEMAAEVAAFWPDLAALMDIRSGEARLPPTYRGVEVPEVGDLDFLRTSTLVFAAALPPGAETVDVGWDASLGAMVLRQEGVAEPFDAYLEPGARSGPVPLSGAGTAGVGAAMAAFLPAGVDAILPFGLDHALFVLGLFLLAPRLGVVAWQVGVLAAGQAVALGLAGAGALSNPAGIVGPLIGLSLLCVGVDNLVSGGRPRVWRPALVAIFGLVHGVALAATFADLPASGGWAELTGFGLGALLGQLMVVALAYLIVVRVLATAQSERALAAVLIGGAVVLLAAFLLPGLAAWRLPLFAAAVLMALSGAAAAAEGSGNYARIVAAPASALIALFGGWWLLAPIVA